jgi:hypothetical protein
MLASLAMFIGHQVAYCRSNHAKVVLSLPNSLQAPVGCTTICFVQIDKIGSLMVSEGLAGHILHKSEPRPVQSSELKICTAAH